MSNRGGSLRLVAIAVVLGIATVVIGLLPSSARAAEQNPNGAFNIVVSPPSVGTEVAPGGSVTVPIKVQNQGIAPERLKVSLMKFGAQGEDGTPSLSDLEPADTFASWAQFSPATFTAEPGVWQTVNLTIKPPKGAAFGYYYAVIFSRDGAQQTAQDQQASLLASVASLVLVDVTAPGAVRKADIAQFSVPNNVQEFLPVDFTVRLHNTGNTHVAPRGNIIITKGKKQVASLEVNLKKGYVLPNSYRVFKVNWSDGYPVRKLQTANGSVVLNKNDAQVSKLDWSRFNPGKLRMGKYQARLVLVYNDGRGDVATEATLSFWVIPWRIIGVVLLVFIVFGSGLWVIFGAPLRRYLKQRKNQRKPTVGNGPRR